MNANEQKPVTECRIYWLDNLRTFMIFLVVLLHAGIVYESSGIPAFFWIVDDPSTNDLSGLLNLVLDIFVMATIFFVAGFLTPRSLARKTPWEFVRSKLTRLMVPWVIAVLTLIPLYKVIFLYSRNLPQEHWTTYFHWSNGIWNQNWLWFLPVLFLFDLLYLIGSKLNLKVSSMKLSQAVAAAFLIGFTYCSFMDLFRLQGWTKTFLIDFQNERLLIYFLIFLVGALCYQVKVLASPAKSRKLYFTVSFTAWVPILLYVFLVLVAILKPGTQLISEVADSLLMQFSFCLSLLCTLYLMIETFRSYLNWQGGFLHALNNTSYGIYIIHVVILGGIAVVLLNVSIPSLAKHLLLTVTTFALSAAIVCFYQKAFRRPVWRGAPEPGGPSAQLGWSKRGSPSQL